MKQIRFNTVRMLALLAIVVSVTTWAVAQPPRGRDGGPRFELGQILPRPLQDELNLTLDQEKELDAIRQDLKAKLEKLLTDEQKQTVANYRPRRPGGPESNNPPPPEGRRRGERPDSAAAEVGNLAPFKLKELPAGVTRVPVEFSGGHDTDPRDHGRPVVLIASALGVTSDVFRDAFSKVRPARGGAEPDPSQVRQNKAVLMEALEKHGITNERLDAVSNQYRFPPGRGSIWTNKGAIANALMKDGAVIGYEIVNGGSGYTTPPTVTVPGFKNASPKVELAFGKDFETNGSVSSLTIAADKSK